jgi:hypothetical protein
LYARTICRVEGLTFTFRGRGGLSSIFTERFDSRIFILYFGSTGIVASFVW